MVMAGKIDILCKALRNRKYNVNVTVEYMFFTSNTYKSNACNCNQNIIINKLIPNSTDIMS